MVVLSELSKGSSSSSTFGYSSSAHGHSSSTDGHRYDVFLSFRGVDTRHSFTDHLHKALIHANINTFLDDEEIETGEDLKPELESAIKASRASVIVLSKNYASSTWCLDELVLILEQRMTSNHIVIPIFYHVEPTHVRKQQSSFGDAMAKHKQTMEAETNANKRIQWAQKMDRWNKALTEVANLKGIDVYERLETEFIEEIVKDIHRRLRVPLRSGQPLLIGMDYSIKFITSWLEDGSSLTTDILTISGMGGIGKTSLAKHFYGLYCLEFPTSSYIEDITRKCDGKFNGLLDLQEQLCGDILKTSSVKVHDVSIYTTKIENAVAHKKVFLVLDDIASVDQLDALLGSKGFHPGSKVIITTKDRWLTQSCALFKTNIKPKHVEHFLEGLHETESQQLFCFHAFMCNHPKAGYEEVSYKLVKYCQGHPLALKVLGTYLHNRDVAYWEGCIKGLKKETDSRINNVLKMSFDSLLSKNDKDLFKYIACYFVGIDRDVTETILEACDINTRSGIPNLIDRCLLSIGQNNELKMHQLVQEMGRYEVHQESPDKPWKRSQIWCNEESFRVLKQKKGKGNIVGLALDMRMLEKEKLRASYINTDALSNMDSLMLLQLNYVPMDGSYNNFPEEIRWLCMHGFPLKSIPSDLSMQNLVALDMSYSNIESFDICYHKPLRPQEKKKLLLGSLKILDFSFCEQLRSLGDFDQLPALERLIVIFCIGLLEVSESIEQCVELVFIDLRYCRKLEKLPRSISNLKKVKTMLLNGCNLGNSLIEHKDMDSVEMCKSNKTIGVNTRNSSSAFVGAIAIPSDLKFFSIPLPISLVELSLSNNNLSTESFPMDFSRLSMLKELYLDNNPIHSMPNCVRTLPKLEILDMRYCDLLKSIEYPPRTLRELRLLDDKDLDDNVLQKVVFDPEMSPLRFQFPWRNFESGFYEIEGVLKIHPMEGVEERVLHSLGWTNLLHNKRMFYEFGIFSTMYGAEEMPSWFTHRSVGASMSFTIPSSSSSSSSSSPNNLKALNFCFVLAMKSLDIQRRAHDDFQRLSMVIISNKTKNLTWIYERHRDKVFRGHKCWVVLSHWMFGVNEMEAGDHVTITVTEKRYDLVKECGVSLVYDNGENKDEEDVLAYYKSWNHIIGGDLSPFQLTTGEYILHNSRFFESDPVLFPCHREFVGEDASYQEHKKEWFRALSRRKPDTIIGDECEGGIFKVQCHPLICLRKRGYMIIRNCFWSKNPHLQYLYILIMKKGENKNNMNGC